MVQQPNGGYRKMGETETINLAQLVALSALCVLQSLFAFRCVKIQGLTLLHSSLESVNFEIVN